MLKLLHPATAPAVNRSSYAIPLSIAAISTQGESLPQPLIPPGWIVVGILLIVLLRRSNRKKRRKNERRRLEARKVRIQSIKTLPWQRFESLVVDAYRQAGYEVKWTGRNGPDGGVDLELRREGGLTLVQCKHWRSRVGVQPVRELFGIVSANQATGGICVGAGGFTPEAKSFAAKTSIQLLDGRGLADLLGEKVDGISAGPIETLSTDCPRCGSPMALRKATRGTQAGKEFWGCTRFPSCRGIRQVSQPEPR